MKDIRIGNNSFLLVLNKAEALALDKRLHSHNPIKESKPLKKVKEKLRVEFEQFTKWKGLVN